MQSFARDKQDVWQYGGHGRGCRPTVVAHEDDPGTMGGHGADSEGYQYCPVPRLCWVGVVYNPNECRWSEVMGRIHGVVEGRLYEGKTQIPAIMPSLTINEIVRTMVWMRCLTLPSA